MNPLPPAASVALGLHFEGVLFADVHRSAWFLLGKSPFGRLNVGWGWRMSGVGTSEVERKAKTKKELCRFVLTHFVVK